MSARLSPPSEDLLAPLRATLTTYANEVADLRDLTRRMQAMIDDRDDMISELQNIINRSHA